MRCKRAYIVPTQHPPAPHLPKGQWDDVQCAAGHLALEDPVPTCTAPPERALGRCAVRCRCRCAIWAGVPGASGRGGGPAFRPAGCRLAPACRRCFPEGHRDGVRHERWRLLGAGPDGGFAASRSIPQGGERGAGVRLGTLALAQRASVVPVGVSFGSAGGCRPRRSGRDGGIGP